MAAAAPLPFQATLQADGYQLVRIELERTVQEVDTTPDAGWHSIFNEEPMYTDSPPESTGRASTDPLSRQCCEEVERELSRHGLLFRGQQVNHVVGVKSFLGCQQQAVHCDMDPTDPVFDEGWANVPKGVLYFPDGGELYVYPAEVACDGDPRIVPVPPGVAVVFRSDLRHSGAPYPNGNRRVFAYVDVPRHSRAVRRNGEWTTDVSYPCQMGTAHRPGHHQKGCPHRKATRLVDKSMAAGSILTARRLNDRLRHLPLPPTGRSHCQLHKRVLGVQHSTKNVMKCATCFVHLCPRCFYSFHTDVDPKPAP